MIQFKKVIFITTIMIDIKSHFFKKNISYLEYDMRLKGHNDHQRNIS